MHVVTPEDFQRNAIYRLDLLEMSFKSLRCAVLSRVDPQHRDVGCGCTRRPRPDSNPIRQHRAKTLNDLPHETSQGRHFYSNGGVEQQMLGVNLSNQCYQRRSPTRAFALSKRTPRGGFRFFCGGQPACSLRLHSVTLGSGMGTPWFSGLLKPTEKTVKNC